MPEIPPHEPSLVVHFGERAPVPNKPKAFYDALVENDIPFRAQSNGGELKPDDFVIAMSSTVDFDELERKGIASYPTPDQMRNAVDKWDLYNWARREGIVTPLTFLMPGKRIADLEAQQGMKDGISVLDRRLGGSIVKPRVTLGEARMILKHVYNTPATDETWSTIADHEMKTGADFVFQKRIPGDILKIYGSLPDSFYYMSLGGEIPPQECPPNIVRFCKYLFNEFDLPWGGVDFIRNPNDGMWYFLDLNPTTGGKKFPEHLKPRFLEQMKRHVEDLRNGGHEREKSDPRIQVFVAAAGVNKRLQTVTGEAPKSLLPLPDGTRIIDKVTNDAGVMAGMNGYVDSVQMMVNPIHKQQFEEWNATVSEKVQLIEPPSRVFGETTSSVDQMVSVLPESDYVMMLGADRLTDVPTEELQRVSEEARKALQDEHYPYVVIGIPTSQKTKYSFGVDGNGSIVACRREDPREGDVFVKKYAVGFDTRKMLFGHVRNTQDAINRLSAAGVPGKMILMNGVNWYADMDTPEDYQGIQNHYE